MKVINEVASEKTEEISEEDYQKKLYNKLIFKRCEIAVQEQCMPYMVGTNTALIQMSKIRPTTLEELKSFSCKYWKFVNSIDLVKKTVEYIKWK